MSDLSVETIRVLLRDDGVAVLTLARPEVHNAFRPLTVQELQHAFSDARDDASIGVVILRGAGDQAFCSGGDQDDIVHAAEVTWPYFQG